MLSYVSLYSKDISLAQCRKPEGGFDLKKLILRRRLKMRENTRLLLRHQREEALNPRKTLIRVDAEGKRRMPFFNRTVNRRPDCKRSPWWQYIEDERYADPTTAKYQLFRLRFRVPYELFVRILEDIRNSDPPMFKETRDAAGRESHPLELKLLGALRVLGRAHTFDDLEEVTFISKDRHRVFFKEFVEKFAEFYYPKVVKAPETEEEIRACMMEYTASGFPGAIGSTDCVHIWWDRCYAGHKNMHKGKEGYPTRAYEVTVNHKRQILAATAGFAGTYNDKTIVRFDGFVDEVHNGKRYGEIGFITLNDNDEPQGHKGQYFRSCFDYFDNCLICRVFDQVYISLRTTAIFHGDV